MLGEGGRRTGISDTSHESESECARQSSSTVQEKRNNMLLANWSPSRCDTCWIISFFIYLQQKTLKILKGTADHQALYKRWTSKEQQGSTPLRAKN